jgi:hypothetical protein
MGQYDEDKDFNDPVVRCTACVKILFREDLQKAGKCIYCGCRKVMSLDVVSDSEIKLLKNKKIDPNFIALFEPIEGVSP